MVAPCTRISCLAMTMAHRSMPFPVWLHARTYSLLRCCYGAQVLAFPTAAPCARALYQPGAAMARRSFLLTLAWLHAHGLLLLHSCSYLTCHAGMRTSLLERASLPPSFVGVFSALDASVARLLLGWGSEATESPLTQSGDGSPESAAAEALR